MQGSTIAHSEEDEEYDDGDLHTYARRGAGGEVQHLRPSFPAPEPVMPRNKAHLQERLKLSPLVVYPPTAAENLGLALYLSNGC